MFPMWMFPWLSETLLRKLDLFASSDYKQKCFQQIQKQLSSKSYVSHVLSERKIGYWKAMFWLNSCKRTQYFKIYGAS